MLNHPTSQYLHGRGAQFNTKNRFLQGERVQEHVEGIDDWEPESTETEIVKDNSRNIVNKMTSGDVGMLYSLNPYQGCEHGCIYCYARNSHEYWGYSAGVDFERKIVVKENAPQLLRNYLNHKNWQPHPISLSGNTDCYQPVERKLKITRRLLEVFLEFRNPVTVLTKNALALRDMDVIQELNRYGLVQVLSSITSVDEKLRLKLEPRTATYRSRLKMIEAFSKAGVPTGIMNAPIIPGINDQDMHDVLQAAANAGAERAGYTFVRLNGAIALLFKDWLEKTFPDKADKVWHHIQSGHAGRVSDSRTGVRMRGDGPVAEIINQQFKLFCKKFGLNEKVWQYDTSHFRRMPENGQLSLF